MYDANMPQTGMHLDGDEVRRRREALALSQELLASEADLHPNTVGSIEIDPTYRTGFKTIRKLARVFDCDPADLYRQESEGAA